LEENLENNASQPTWVVADAINIFTYNPDKEFEPVGERLRCLFGISPTSHLDLTQRVKDRRPDLLIGAIDQSKNKLIILGGTLALEPHSSSIIRSVTIALGLVSCQKTLIVEEVPLYTWEISVSDMIGGVPDKLYHGTSDKYLSEIRRKGLITFAGSNWDILPSGHVHLAAAPQVAAMHAANTQGRIGGRPIVVACRRPNHLLPDWDVRRGLVRAVEIPSHDGRSLAREVGLFASPNPIPADTIIEIKEPQERGGDYLSWPSR
jgi:hypothetical protein